MGAAPQRVLLLGASGLVGEAILARLLRAGHEVRAVARDVGAPERRWPEVRWLSCDIARLTTPERWSSLLEGVDTVVNAAGALQDGARDDVASVQRDAPLALFAACAAGGVRRIVQISAAGAAPDAPTAFMRTKAAADAGLRASPLEWFVLRPGLVLAPQAYGGTALLRGLAAVPLAVPIVAGLGRIRTVHVEDVADAVRLCIEGAVPSRVAYDLVEAEAHDVADILLALRAWQGWPPARRLHLPAWTAMPLVAAADLAGRLGWRSPLRRTGWAEARRGVAGDPSAWHRAAGWTPRPLAQSLRDLPATIQERWFSRIWPLKPLLILGLALFWVASGLVGLWRFPAAMAVLTERGIGHGFAALAVAGGAAADIGLGALVLLRRRARVALLGMLGLSGAYLVGASLVAPDLWADPLGPLVKVLPAMLAALLALAILEER
ncbi:MAG: SDR family oxidoreductase [Acetobacteraceae bacterium]|nr:SDR family oxidoreductase [Acetobacteraceae bacterium]